MRNRVSESWGGGQDDGNEAGTGLSDDVMGVVHQQVDVVKRQAQQLADQMEEFIRTRPAAALGIAVAAGVALGWLIKRR